MKTVYKIISVLVLVCINSLQAATIQSLSHRSNKYVKLAQLQRAQLYINQGEYKKALQALYACI